MTIKKNNYNYNMYLVNYLCLILLKQQFNNQLFPTIPWSTTKKTELQKNDIEKQQSRHLNIPCTIQTNLLSTKLYIRETPRSGRINNRRVVPLGQAFGWTPSHF